MHFAGGASIGAILNFRVADPSPGAPAFECPGARFFAVFEGAGFRFTDAPELPAKKTKNVEGELVS
jgi:hypothetical protein